MDNYLWNVECDNIITSLHKPYVRNMVLLRKTSP